MGTLASLGFLAAAAVVTVAPGSLAQPRASGFRVIVHSTNAITTLDRRTLADIFLKKTTQWADGEVIRPVDLDSDASARRRFSEMVLRRSVEAAKNYWHQQVFSGRDVPPPEFDTDEEVIRYVQRHRGGIGYVSDTATLDGVRVLTVK